MSISIEVIESTETASKITLGAWNLAVNTDKIEKTKLKREVKKATETWRSTKKLGDYEEMRRRKQVAAVSFNNLWRL